MAGGINALANTLGKVDSNNALVVTIDSGSTGVVLSVTGTANQITASPTTGAVVLSVPVAFIAPGSIAATTTVGGTTITASVGLVGPSVRAAAATILTLSTDGAIKATNSAASAGVTLNVATDAALIVADRAGTGDATVQAGQTASATRVVVGSISSGYPGFNLGASGSATRFGAIAAGRYRFADNADTTGFEINALTNSTAKVTALGGGDTGVLDARTFSTSGVSGVSGSWLSADAKTITATRGIITSIV